MLKDYIEVTKSEIRDTVRRHRGLDVPKESAERCLDEINSVIFEEKPEARLCLKDFLRLFYSNSDDETDFLDPEAPIYNVWVFPEADKYHQEVNYPLIFRKAGLLEKRDGRIRIDNLRRFLADYQKQTNAWISSDDIMNAEILEMKMISGGRNLGWLAIRIRIE